MMDYGDRWTRVQKFLYTASGSAQSKLIGQVIRQMITGCKLKEYGLYKLPKKWEMGTHIV